MPIFSQTFFSFVCGNLVSFSFFTARHNRNFKMLLNNNFNFFALTIAQPEL